MIYSANMLKTYKACPLKYKLKYVERFSLPQKFEVFEKGKKIHALAYYYLKGDDVSKMETALSPEEMNIWVMLKSNEFFNKKTYRAEFDLNCKVGGFWVGGRLDAVVYDEENNYYILDYKTGGVPANPQEDLQTLVYLAALEAHLKGDFKCPRDFRDKERERKSGVAYETAQPRVDSRERGKQVAENCFISLKFVYIDLKKNKNYIIDNTLVHTEIIEHICRQIESEKFPSCEDCGDCEYVSYCC